MLASHLHSSLFRKSCLCHLEIQNTKCNLLVTHVISPRSVKDREAAESNNPEKSYTAQGRWTFSYPRVAFFFFSHSLSLISDIPAFFTLKTSPSFPVIFFFFKMYFELPICYTLQRTNTTFRDPSKPCVQVWSSQALTHWWCKLRHGRDAAPGTFKCHSKTEVLPCFLKALCCSPAARKDAS